METAAAEAASFREQAQACNQKAQAASRQVSEADIGLEAHRRSTMQLLTLAGQARSQTAQAEESLASLEREAERLENERNAAKREAESLGAERGQASLTFESVTEALKRLEGEIESLRAEIIEQARRRSLKYAVKAMDCAPSLPR